MGFNTQRSQLSHLSKIGGENNEILGKDGNQSARDDTISNQILLSSRKSCLSISKKSVQSDLKRLGISKTRNNKVFSISSLNVKEVSKMKVSGLMSPVRGSKQ